MRSFTARETGAAAGALRARVAEWVGDRSAAWARALWERDTG
jgi:hypothetical protein